MAETKEEKTENGYITELVIFECRVCYETSKFACIFQTFKTSENWNEEPKECPINLDNEADWEQIY